MSGRVLTFLFTDIEGSTQLLEKDGQIYAAALAEHRRILRRVCATHGGDEMGTAGDAYHATFERPASAVAAAVEAQRMLRSHDWPEGCALRVRMGLHTGDVEVDGADYVGLTVHAVSRVCDSAHGGQIVASGATIDAAEQDALPPQVTTRPLGSFPLRGVEAEVSLHQVIHPELPADFPPLRIGDPAKDRTSRPEEIRVLLVDDQELVRAGFRMILGAMDRVTIVGEAANGLEAIEEARRTKPHVVLMDVRMPVMNGIEATGRITAEPDPPKVVILTTFDLDEYVYDALRAGASGFLLKDAPPAELARAIQVVAAGDALLAPSVTRRLVEEFTTASNSGRTAAPGSDPSRGDTRPPTLDRLTEREVEVLSEVAKGMSNAEVATALFISETTVKSHVRGILTKLGLRDRVQAVVAAYEAGLVSRGESPERKNPQD